MHGRTLARWIVLVGLVLSLLACRSSRVGGRSVDAIPAKDVAAQVEVPPEAASAESVEPRPDAGESAAPDAAGGASPEPVAIGPTPGAGPDADPGPHCGEPPERIAARENMRRMAEEHERLAAGLAALRAELRSQMAATAASLDLQRMPEIAADLARRNAEIPGAAPVGADYLETILREAAFWGALCGALGGRRGDCGRLDAEEDGDGAFCESVVRLVRLARARPERLSLLSGLGWAFGWTWTRQNDARIWQIVRHGKGEESCTKLDGRDPAERWSGPACRALAARDVSRCDALTEPSRRRTCAALVHAILGPGAATGDAPSAAGAFLREHVAPTGARAACADALGPVLDELVDNTGLFQLLPLVLPGIEAERGLAPAP